VKAFNAGSTSTSARCITTTCSLINDAAQSPIAGKGRVLGHPGDGKTIGYTMLYILTAPAKSREWAWKLLQYLGGARRTVQYTQANRCAADAMLGSGYQSVMESEAAQEGLVEVGRRADDSRRLEQGAELRRRRPGGLAEVVSRAGAS
jgi:hypothetical protein